MGKNRKIRNGVDQVQNNSILETENPNQDIPDDFLTSDDFCVVQNKKGSKKYPESVNAKALFRSLSDSGNNVKVLSGFKDEESGKSHNSFWTCRINGSASDDSVAGSSSSDSQLHSLNSELQSSSVDSDLNLNDILQFKSIKKESVLENCEQQLKDPKHAVDYQKNIKKYSENDTTKALFSSFSDSDNDVVILSSSYEEKSSKNLTSFWTGSINESTSDDSVTGSSSDSQLHSCSSELQISSDDSELNSNDILKLKNINCCAETPLDNAEKQFENTNTELSDPVTVTNEDIEEESTVFELVVSENVCNTKKKSKKEQKKKIIDEEVEKILKELEMDEKSIVEPNSKTSNYSSNFSEGNNNNAESSSTSVKNNEKKSSKKKDKQAKSKQNILENESLKSSVVSEMNGHDMQQLEEAVGAESVANSNEEKASLYKNMAESSRKGKNRPSKKQLAIIHEALKKAKEEEEKMKKEAEIKQKMLEEADRIRQEKLCAEQEKKEKKKLKEKQRRQKMKAEGRLLSKSQKQSRARMEATLAALREQGVDVPQINKKPLYSHGPRLGNNKTFHRKRYDSSQSTQSSDSAIVSSERQKSVSLSSQESSGKENLSDLPNSFDSTEESALMPESDKGHFSCSDVSGALDVRFNCDILKSEKSTAVKDKKLLQNKTEPPNQELVKTLEANCVVNTVKYRSPVVCVLGHVDTGKTKLLDYIRKTHVQDSEAGGITQQIGATMIPQDALKEKCKMAKDFSSAKLEIPGLLVIDTPGHESFGNLRSRGSSICDIAILVVDIMHGLEPQTIESINLLKKGKTPFIVALNKIDRIYGWKSAKDEDIENTIKNQSQSTQIQFKNRCQEIILQFANECLNAALFYENKDPRSYVSMVPTSAITGDGMGNLLSVVSLLTQTLMHKRLIYSDQLEATVLEVKAICGLGTTIDVILVNGCLREGDTIVIAGQEGPIVTQIRSLLMPQPLKELRVKNPYIEYKVVEGAQGVKISGKDLEKAVAGLPLLIASNHTKIDSLKDEINNLFHDAMNSIKTSERGVYVQASTLGSLEALLEFLTSSGIPYFQVKIGPVVKKDVMKASVMLEHDSVYAAILAFDVKIERDAQDLADNLGVHIFHANIIYHLFDMYIKYRDELLLKRNEEIKRHAVFPCRLRILPEYVFNPKDPIIMCVHVEQGILKEGTPLCALSRDILDVGVVSSIEMHGNKVDCAKKGDEVCIKIDAKPGESSKSYGRHFTHEDLLVSRITRQSIDICKEYFKNELQSSDWHLIVELKKTLHIV